MMKNALFNKAIIFWGVIILLAGCAPTKPYLLNDVQRDPQFTLIEMLATGLVLGGVTVTAFPVTVEERNAITAQLEDVLTQFSFYKVLTPEPLGKRIETQRYESILKYFEKNKTIPVEEIKSLRSIYTPARYILFVNIDSNTVSRRKVFNPDSVEYRSIRTIQATLNIINLDTETPVLFTQITFRDVNSESIQRFGARGVFGNMIAQVTFGGFPEPPSTTQTLYKVFLAVADQVPSN